MVKTLAALVGLAAAIPFAHADPCAQLNDEEAQLAQQVVEPGSVVVEWCAQCGEAVPAPSSAERVYAVALDRQGPDSLELRVNERFVPAAYLYVLSTDGVFSNVARLAGCQAQGPGTLMLPVADADVEFTPEQEERLALLATADPAPAPLAGAADDSQAVQVEEDQHALADEEARSAGELKDREPVEAATATVSLEGLELTDDADALNESGTGAQMALACCCAAPDAKGGFCAEGFPEP